MTKAVQAVSSWPFAIVLAAAVMLLVDDLLSATAPGFDTDRVALWLCVVIGLTGLTATVGLQTVAQRITRAGPRVVLRVAVSAAAAALALAGAEVATRSLYRDITTTSDDRGFFSRRWHRASVQLNSQGFREREFSPVKAPGVYRIAVVGDSFTYGNGLDAADRYSAHLQRALGDGYEVLNFGVPGHNTPELAAELRGRVGSFAPDFALVQWFVNDVEGDSRSRPGYRPLIAIDAVHTTLHEYSAVYSLLDSWWTRRQVRGLAAGSYADYLTRNYGDGQADAVRVDRQAVRALFAAARSRSIGIGMVLFPDASYDLDDRYPFEFLHQRVLGLCAEAQVTCLDLRPALAAVRDRRTLWVNRLDSHPSAQANAIAATEILRTFELAWLTRAR